VLPPISIEGEGFIRSLDAATVPEELASQSAPS
jgi:hypothetical protein